MTILNPSAEETANEIPLLQQRLMELGVPAEDIIFQCDKDWERIQAMAATTHSQDQQYNSNVTFHPDNVVELKTLVWQVTCHENHMPCPIDQDCCFYVVAALGLEDKADTSLLRDLICKHQDLPYGRVPHKLSLAPREIAEALTGFQSGCMPPIGHTTPLRLYLDSSVIDERDKNDSDDEEMMVSIGSGLLGQSLILPLTQFLQVAARTGGVRVGSFLQPKSTTATTAVANSLTAFELRQQRKQERVDRQSKPKDRLAEYRRFRKLSDKAKLLRTTARRKGRLEDMKQLVDEAVRTGEFPQLLQVHPEDGLDKNALHLSAWRGDIETVQLLVETARRVCPEFDVVNQISRGEGNYGKTPIFFALTQCREDVTRYLLEQGASLLFVNNKGQTPCSIAVTHLNEEVCEELYHIEAQQLKAGGRFADYRMSHSDKKFYGDLDPRFPIDNYNFGEDLAEPLHKFQQSVEKAGPSTIVDGIPTVFSPRSVRPTVRWWNREDESLEAANNREGAITFTQPRAVSARKKSPERNPSRREASPMRDVLPVIEDINSLPLLTLDGVLKEHDDKDSVVLVNCTETIRQLEEEIDATIEFFSNPERQADMSQDAILANSTWGLDCEWKPGVDRGKDNPVATLQLSTQHRSYLIDVQSLCQSTHGSAEGASKVTPTETENQLNSALEKLFMSPSMPILGFGIMQDLGKLTASFPHLSCFAEYVSVIDLQNVASVIYPKGSRPLLSSLQKMVAVLLHKRLDKSQQCSDWTQRPLSPAQINYATLDAAVLPLLLKMIVQNSITVERYHGQFFAVHTNLQSNLRYVFLEDVSDDLETKAKDDEELIWHIPMGSIRTSLSRPVARQCWPLTQAPPPMPGRILVDPKRMSKKERAHIAKVGTADGTEKPKPIQLKSLSANLSNLPIPGITLGYTKDSCAERVVGHEFMNTLPQGTHIGFNRRAGVAETNNAWIIFCNFGGNADRHFHMERKSSEFSEGGRYLTFQVNPQRQNGKSSERTLTDYVTSNGTGKAILLFARDGTSSKYTFCGEARCIKYKIENKASVDLTLELMDYEQLAGEKRISSNFVDLVRRREEMFHEMGVRA